MRSGKSCGQDTLTIPLKLPAVLLTGVSSGGLIHCFDQDIQRLWRLTTCLFWTTNSALRIYTSQCRLLGMKVRFGFSIFSLLILTSNSFIVTKKSPHALFFTTLSTLKWPLLSAVFPRLCLTAFNFCQPFLINAAISVAQQPITSKTTNAGHGLIGAYFLVYTGISVSLPMRMPETSSY